MTMCVDDVRRIRETEYVDKLKSLGKLCIEVRQNHLQNVLMTTFATDTVYDLQKHTPDIRALMLIEARSTSIVSLPWDTVTPLNVSLHRAAPAPYRIACRSSIGVVT